MRLSIFLGGAATLTAVPFALAKFAPSLPPATQALEQRQAAATTAEGAPAARISDDPWQCITEDIAQYFEGPTPSGSVMEAINSFGGELIRPCMATARGPDMYSCTLEPGEWCGFTAAPEVRSGYAAYVSDAVSYWTMRSETVEVLATSCASAWRRYHAANHGWMSIALAHAECHLRGGHPQTETEGGRGGEFFYGGPASDPTQDGSGESSPTAADSMAVAGRGVALQSLALMGMGVAILINAA